MVVVDFDERARRRRSCRPNSLDARRDSLSRSAQRAPACSRPRSVDRWRELEGLFIAETLKSTGGNREEAAEMLGIGERTLYRKIKEYGLN